MALDLFDNCSPCNHKHITNACAGDVSCATLRLDMTGCMWHLKVLGGTRARKSSCQYLPILHRQGLYLSKLGRAMHIALVKV